MHRHMVDASILEERWEAVYHFYY